MTVLLHKMSAAQGILLALMLLAAVLQVQASRVQEQTIVGFTRTVSFQKFGEGLSTFVTFRVSSGLEPFQAIVADHESSALPQNMQELTAERYTLL